MHDRAGFRPVWEGPSELLGDHDVHHPGHISADDFIQEVQYFCPDHLLDLGAKHFRREEVVLLRVEVRIVRQFLVFFCNKSSSKPSLPFIARPVSSLGVN